MQERVGCSVLKDKNRRSVVKEGIGIPYQYFGTSVHKTFTFNFQQNDEIQVGAYPNRQFVDPELPFEMEGTKCHKRLAISNEI